MTSPHSPASILSPDALEFAPGLLAIQESPPPALPRRVLWTVAILFVLLLLWAIFGQLDIIASTEGKLVPESFVKIVQPADAGIVQEILVKEGQAVTQGQLLMRMDRQLTQADLNTLNQDVTSKRLQLRRIQAELSNQPLRIEKDDAPALFNQVFAQYLAHRQQYENELGQEQQVLAKAKHDLVTAEELLTKLHKTVPTYQQTAQAYQDLVKDGYVGKIEAEDKQREAIEKEQDLKAQYSTVAGLRAAITQSERKIAAIIGTYHRQLQDEYVQLKTELTKAEQELSKVEHKSQLLELRAPHAGIVKELSTHTVGTVVSPGTVLMTVVPQAEPLQAEVAVKNEDVGFVHVGQTVQVKLAAYPFQKYGMLEGTVVHLGADANEANPNNGGNSSANSNNPTANPAANNLTYKAHIKLPVQSLTVDGQPLKLQAGMLVNAEIHQGRRTVWEYLTSPVQKAFMEAARER